MTSLISCKVEGPAVRLSWGPCPVSTLCYSSLFPAPVYRAKHLSRYIILGLPKRPFSYFPLLTAYKRLATAGCSARASERARRNMHWRQKLAGRARTTSSVLQLDERARGRGARGHGESGTKWGGRSWEKYGPGTWECCERQQEAADSHSRIQRGHRAWSRGVTERAARYSGYLHDNGKLAPPPPLYLHSSNGTLLP